MITSQILTKKTQTLSEPLVLSYPKGFLWKKQLTQLAQRINLFLIRWTTWEFLPMWLSNIPVAVMYLWFALRARHPLFFSAANPSIPLGGALGVSKFDMLMRLPTEILPKTILLKDGCFMSDALEKVRQVGLDFPLIAKPDIGERGKGVAKIEGIRALFEYIATHKGDIIIQEFLSEPEELTVLFYRNPNENRHFNITSVSQKVFLSVQGDGHRTVRDLLRGSARGAFQIPRFEREKPTLLEKIPFNGEKIMLEPIGNHNRGTQFLDACHIIDEQLTETFERLTRIKGVYYGRFDLKCQSIEALKKGHFKAVELNGVFGEPVHIYQPNFGMFNAYKVFWKHWQIIFKLSRVNIKAGFQLPAYKIGYSIVQRWWA
jgi:hypothetical protein